jgi:hypothetical protein
MSCPARIQALVPTIDTGRRVQVCAAASGCDRPVVIAWLRLRWATPRRWRLTTPAATAASNTADADGTAVAGTHCRKRGDHGSCGPGSG